MTPYRIPQILVASAAFLFGCGANHETPPNGGGAVPGDAGSNVSPAEIRPCAEFARLICSKVKECEPFWFEADFADEAACRARHSARCEYLGGLAESNTGADFWRACGEATAQQSCEEYRLGTSPQVCYYPAGGRPNQTSCIGSVQCASLNCHYYAGADCGVCLPSARTTMAGGACSNANQCAQGLICRAGRCAPPALEGEVCTTHDDCSGYLVCRAMVCAHPLAEGSICQEEAQCGLEASCAKSGTCLPDRLVAPGEPCGRLPDGTFAYCRGGYDCNKSGVCQAMPRAGESCSAEGLACQGFNECRAGHCATPEADICPIDGPVPVPPKVNRCGTCAMDAECGAGLVCGHVTPDATLGFCVPPQGTTTCCLGGSSGGVTTSICLYVRGELHR